MIPLLGRRRHRMAGRGRRRRRPIGPHPRL